MKTILFFSLSFLYVFIFNSNCVFLKSMSLPESVRVLAEVAKSSVIPVKSKNRYDNAYETFTYWQNTNGCENNFAEDVLLAYFVHLKQSNAPTSLWAIYSMLKSTITYNQKNINIGQYAKLTAFLKQQSKGYHPKKAEVFTDEQISNFLDNAPNSIHLAHKVITIFGILGGCRSDELVNLTTAAVKEQGSMFLVTIPKTKTSISRCFTISDPHFELVKSYITLRPPNIPNRFFLSYRNAKVTKQPIGKNTIAKTPEKIALFLNLPNPNLYTGHSFRRTSTTILANAGADILTIQRHGGWKSSTVAKSYIEDSVGYKKKTEQLITNELLQSSRKRTSHDHPFVDPNLSDSYPESDNETNIYQPSSPSPRKKTPFKPNFDCTVEIPEDLLNIPSPEMKQASTNTTQLSHSTFSEENMNNNWGKKINLPPTRNMKPLSHSTSTKSSTTNSSAKKFNLTPAANIKQVSQTTIAENIVTTISLPEETHHDISRKHNLPLQPTSSTRDPKIQEMLKGNTFNNCSFHFSFND